MNRRNWNRHCRIQNKRRAINLVLELSVSDVTFWWRHGAVVDESQTIPVALGDVTIHGVVAGVCLAAHEPIDRDGDERWMTVSASIYQDRGLTHRDLLRNWHAILLGLFELPSILLCIFMHRWGSSVQITSGFFCFLRIFNVLHKILQEWGSDLFNCCSYFNFSTY